MVENNKLHTIRGINNPNPPGPFNVICSVKLDKSQFEFANVAGKWNNFYYDFIQKNQDYNLRDYWLDYAKHYRLVLFVEDNLDASKLPILNVVSRASLASILHTGYDDFIAEYNEEVKNPQYDAVIFPYKYSLGSSTYYKIGVYQADLFVSYNFPISSPLDIKNAVDLRVPSEIYDLSGAIYPFNSVPTFKKIIVGGVETWVGESPKQYCDRTFYSLLAAYKEVTVLYSQSLPVSPCEKIAVRGANMLIAEIEDDLVNETTRVIGRRFE
jgi:hypothetical protein